MNIGSTAASRQLPRLRIAAINDVYELSNLPKVQTFLSKLSPSPVAVVLAGDFLSPSNLSALDGGKEGMVNTLRAIGLTHASLGNHEADFKLPHLQKRLAGLSKSVKVLNTNVGNPSDKLFLTEDLLQYDIIQTPCERVKVALIGLLSDEQGVFRDDKFRGQEIRNVLDTYDEYFQKLVMGNMVDTILPMTHEGIARDRELAKHILELAPGKKHVLLGGHDHVPFDETITNDNNNGLVRITKSGCEAEAVSLLDLTFDWVDEGSKRAQIVDIDYDLVEMSKYENSFVVQQVVDEHMALLKNLQNEILVQTDDFIPPGGKLSSEGTRLQQTSVGSIFCKAIKEELEVDVAMINGASIKGNRAYKNKNMTYEDLKRELPFPTKIVTVPMKRWELHEAIYYSRTNIPEDDVKHVQSEEGKIERKGFLQVDLDFDRLGFHYGNSEDELLVALPRNLLNGFCQIKPLVKVKERLQADGRLPLEDDYIPADHLVVRHFSKERWWGIVKDRLTFDDIDSDHKGFISREDVERMLRDAIGHDPPEFLINDMIAAVDVDKNGIIDPGEFSYLVAQMEREHGFARFR